MRQDRSHTPSSSRWTPRLWQGALCLALASVLWLGIDELNRSSQGLGPASGSGSLALLHRPGIGVAPPPTDGLKAPSPQRGHAVLGGHAVIERAIIPGPGPEHRILNDALPPGDGNRFKQTEQPATLDLPLAEVSTDLAPSRKSARPLKASPTEKTVAQAPRFADVASLVSGQGVVEVPLRSESGGLWVDVRLNDKVTYRMLLDTGASVVIVPGALAEDLGIHEGGVERELRTIQGSLKGKLVTLDRIGLGTAQATDVPAVVLRGEDQTVGLLGRSFLSRFAFGVDLDKGTLTLRPRQTSARLVPAASPTQQLAKAAQLFAAPTEYAPAQFVANQLQRLETEKQRAAADPHLKPGYLAQLDQAVDHWKNRQQLYQ